MTSGMGGNAVVMRKSWFKAPASSSGRRGQKPYFSFSPCWYSLTTEVRTSYRQEIPPPVTTERYFLCRLNAGPGEENPDEPPDCLYGLQVRGSPFSLRGSLSVASERISVGRPTFWPQTAYCTYDWCFVYCYVISLSWALVFRIIAYTTFIFIEHS